MSSILLCVLLLVPFPVVFAHEPQDRGQSTQSATPTPTPDIQPSPLSPSERQSHDEANLAMQDEIRDIFEADPILDGAHIHPAVDDETITLIGTVNSEAQHRRALQLVDPYTQWRKVVDKITVE